MSLRSCIARAVARPRSWLCAVFRREELEERMEFELACHLEILIHDLIQSGFSPEEAARQARIALGPMLKHKENMRASLGLRWWDEILADLSYGIRILGKNPGFTIVAALSLGLAIGANTTIFSLARQLLYERLHVPHAADLRLLSWTGTEDHVAVHHVWGDWDPLPGGRAASTAFSYPAYQQLRRENHVLDDLFAFKRMGMIATLDGEGQKVRTEMVSGNYFAALKVQPELGRTIQPSDDATPGQGAVAMISDAFWERVFARSPAVLGQTVKLDNYLLTIVGVSPKGFTGARDVLQPADFFVPLTMQPLLVPRPGRTSLFVDPSTWWVNVMGRAKPGVNNAEVQSALDGELAAIVRGTMIVKAGDDLPRLDLRDGSRGLFAQEKEYARPMAVLMTLVGFVLLLACANIANLMLARGSKRQREMSVRLAVGAGRVRIVRQMLVESLLLAALGGAVGILTGYLGSNLIPTMIGNAWERTDFHIHFDWRVLIFTAGITVMTGVLFGLAPAFTAARTGLSHGLNENAQTLTRRSKGIGGKALVGVQVALSTLLVIGAGLYLRTLAELSSVSLGFNPDHLLLAEIDPPPGRYPAGSDVVLHQRLEQLFGGVPGVTAVTLAEEPYIADGRSANDFLPEGEAYNQSENQEEDYNIVGNQFFKTLDIPMIAGRAFGPLDTRSAQKVAVINESLARKRFPGQSPIGKRFVTDPHDSDGGGGPLLKDSFEIVGVCGDTRYTNLRDDPPPQFFLSYVQKANVGGMVYEIRTQIAPEAILPSLREIVRQVDPDLALVNVRTQDQQIEAALQQERIFVTLTSGFGLLALALAAVGIYGVMAFLVAHRTNEIGIRIALGARPGQVRAMILQESTGMALAGIVAGLAAALTLTRVVKSMFYGIQPYDPITILGGVVVLIVVALAASWVPACRAASVQPMEALRRQ